MDGFWHSRCLNHRIEVADMMRLFPGGATTPLVVKIGTKQPWVKIENWRNFDCNFALSRGKIWLWLFYNFFALWFQDSTQKISSHFKQKWRRDGDFSEFWFYFESRKSMSWHYFCLKLLEMFCIQSLNHKIFLKYSYSNFASRLREIAIKVAQISYFSKIKVQSLDIATLLGAEGPQQGPQGPKGPEGPPALRRS